MMRVAALASNNGSAMRAVHRAIGEGRLKAELVLVISNKSAAPALSFATDHAIPAQYINDDRQLARALEAAAPDFIILSGYLKKIPPELLAKKLAPMINIHPSLLPKYGGKGMFGMNVHRAVIAAQEEWTGATTHFVNENYDQGEIIAQTKLAVSPDDSPESLAQKVMKIEEELMVATLEKIYS